MANTPEIHSLSEDGYLMVEYLGHLIPEHLVSLVTEDGVAPAHVAAVGDLFESREEYYSASIDELEPHKAYLNLNWHEATERWKVLATASSNS